MADLFAPPSEEELAKARKDLAEQELFAPPTEEELRTVSQPPDTVAGAQPDAGAKAPAAEETDYLGAFAQGAKETVAPGLVTDQELQESKDYTLGETLASLAGSIGIDLAAAAAATKTGAAAGTLIGGPGVGTAVGAGAGLLGYALYSGLGQEELAEKRSGEYSKTRAAARVGLNIIPIARHGNALGKALSQLSSKADDILRVGEKTGAKVARLGTQVAGESAVAGSEFGAEAAGFAGALSLLMHGIGYSGKAPGLKKSDAIAAFTESDAGVETSARIARRVHDEAGVLAREGTYSEDKVTYEFSQWLLGKKVRMPKERAARYMAQLDSDETRDEVFTNFLIHQIAKDELSKTVDVMRSRVTKGGKFVDDHEPMAKATASFRDGQAAAREIDRKTGMDVTRALNEISHERGQFENFQVTADNLAYKAYKDQKRGGISDDEMGKLRAYLSGEDGTEELKPQLAKFFGPDGNLTPKAQKAVESWSKVWDLLRDAIQERGFEVGQRPVYFPEMRTTGSDLLSKVKETISAVNGLRGKMPKDLVDWNSEGLVKAGLKEVEAKELMTSILEAKKLRRRYGVKGEFDFNSLYGLEQAVLNKNQRSRSGAELSAIFERGNTPIPEKYREWNIRQAYINYMNGNVKGAIMSESLRRMSGLEQAFRSAGLEQTADWTNKMLDDISGGIRMSVRQWLANKENAMRFRIAAGMKNADNVWESLGWKTANLGMEGFGVMQAGLYPAYVGMNVAANIRNLSQNIAQAAPELGGAYGYNAVMRALFSNPFKHFKKLQKEGVIAKGATAESLRPEDSALVKQWGRWGDRSMLLYQATDSLNRLWAYNIGHVMAKDLAKGNQLAIESLGKLGPAVITALKREGIDSLEAFQRDTDKLGDVLGKMLVGKTQFHYGTEQKAEFLRDIGPLFSMFTKWPFAVGSDIGTIMRENPKLKDKAYRFMERYGSIWILANYAASFQDDAPAELNYLVGDLKSWAPAQSPIDISLLNNPRVEAAMAIPSIAKKVLEAEDPNEALKTLVKQVTREGVKIGVPGVSSIINELDKLKSKQGETPPSQNWVDELFGD